MEGIQIEQHNNDVAAPYDQLPPKKALNYKIYCRDFDHRDQVVQYLIMSKSNHILQSRLACLKCIQGPLSGCSQDVAILEDVIQDNFNLLKYTKFQENTYQQFSDLLHASDFTFDKSLIEFKLNKLQETITYQFQLLKEKLFSQYDEYIKVKKEFDGLKKATEKTFDFTKIGENLQQFSKLGKNPSPKQWTDLNQKLDEYVNQFHQGGTEILQGTLTGLKKNLSQQNQLILHKHKLDQGIENILKEIQEMEKTFSPKLFQQSELANDQISEVLCRIDPKYSKFEEVDTIKRIYSSLYEGLNYKKLISALDKAGGQAQLLFVFKSPASQLFGAFVSPQRDKSLLFQLNKKQIYPIKATPQQQAPVQQNNLGYQGNTTGTIQQFQGNTTGIPQQVPSSQPIVSNPGLPNTKQSSNPQSIPSSTYYVETKANDNSILLKFGNEDLIIMSSFNNCTSKLGVGFNIAGFEIGNVEMHLANAKQFQINSLEVFTVV